MGININPTANLSNKDYIPPKDWDVLTDSEKIERLREIIKHQSSQIGMAQTHIHNLRIKLKRHAHQDGKVVEIKEVQDYDDNSNGLNGVSTFSNEKYF